MANTRARSSASRALVARADSGSARTTTRESANSASIGRIRCRSRRLTRFRQTAGPTCRPTTNPTRAGPGRPSRCTTTVREPARRPCRTTSAYSAPRRIRAVPGSITITPGWAGSAPRGSVTRCARAPATQTVRLARPLRRRAAKMARPARVRIRSRKPCTLCRRRLFGWKVRLLTSTTLFVRASCGAPSLAGRRPYTRLAPPTHGPATG